MAPDSTSERSLNQVSKCTSSAVEHLAVVLDGPRLAPLERIGVVGHLGGPLDDVLARRSRPRAAAVPALRAASEAA